LFNAELIVFDNVVYRLSISLFSLMIFAVKLKNFRKTYDILHVFLLSQILREENGAFQNCTCFNTTT